MDLQDLIRRARLLLMGAQRYSPHGCATPMRGKSTTCRQSGILSPKGSATLAWSPQTARFLADFPASHRLAAHQRGEAIGKVALLDLSVENSQTCRATQRGTPCVQRSVDRHFTLTCAHRSESRIRSQMSNSGMPNVKITSTHPSYVCTRNVHRCKCGTFVWLEPGQPRVSALSPISTT